MDRSEVETWQTVANGWERQTEIFTAATRQLIERLVELARLDGDELVLELAAGPGETGFAAAQRLQGEGRLISSDFAPEMVEVARRRGAARGVANADYRVIDAMAIALDDASVDAVLCRFGVMLTPEPAGALGEINRVLRPGGRLAIAVWAEPERNRWVSTTGTVARELGLSPPPAPDAPGPFRLADKGRLRSLVEAAGFEIDTLEEVPIAWRAATVDEWWETTVDTSPTLAALAAEAADDDLARVRSLSEERIRDAVGPDGSLDLPGVAIVVGATRR